MKRVVMFSGGVGSWAAAKRVAEKHGTDDLTLLFADTRVEDPDTYRFLVEAAGNVFGAPLLVHGGGEGAREYVEWSVARDGSAEIDLRPTTWPACDSRLVMAGPTRPRYATRRTSRKTTYTNGPPARVCVSSGSMCSGCHTRIAAAGA